MGKKFIVFDDLDGTEDAEVRSFGLAGALYEIDLTDSNFEKLEKALQPFIEKGRRAGRAGPVRSNGSKKVANPQLDAIRQWAAKNGHRVSDKGRIPRDVVDAYDEANKPVPMQAAPAKAATKKASEPAFSAATS